MAIMCMTDQWVKNLTVPNGRQERLDAFGPATVSALSEDGCPYVKVAEHARILDAFETRDSGFAAAAMRVCLKQTGEIIERSLQQMEANDA